MFGAQHRSAFINGTEFPKHIVDRIAVLGERAGSQLDSEFVAAGQRPQVAGLASGHRNNYAVIRKKHPERHARRCQRLLVGLVTDGEVAGEKNHAGGVGVGKVHGAVVGEGHGERLAMHH